MFKTRLRNIFFALCALALSSCSVYRMEIQQGNALSNETVSQLQRGMNKAQVAALIGSPLLQDNFRGGDRWDYVYYKLRSKTPSKKQNLTLFFKNDELVQVTK